MVTPDKYNKLTQLQQATMIWQSGALVGELCDKLYNYALYQLHDFYVEIKFSKGNFVLQEICGFNAGCSQLDLYIKEIDISPVYIA